MMSIRDTLINDRTVFMKSGEKDKLDVVRMVIGDLENVEKTPQGPVTFDDAKMVSFLNKQVSAREKTAQEYLSKGVVDRAEKEQFEISVIKNYLPAAPSAEEVTKMIQKALDDLGITEPTIKDTGKIVKQIDNPAVGGKDVSAYIKAL